MSQLQATGTYCVLIEENMHGHGFWVLKQVVPCASREHCVEQAIRATQTYRPYLYRRRKASRSVFQLGDDSWLIRLHTGLALFSNETVHFRVSIGQHVGDFDPDGRPVARA